ncbi:unnamed protein product, partial [Protopolystoma xenopodis]
RFLETQFFFVSTTSWSAYLKSNDIFASFPFFPPPPDKSSNLSHRRVKSKYATEPDLRHRSPIFSPLHVCRMLSGMAQQALCSPSPPTRRKRVRESESCSESPEPQCHEPSGSRRLAQACGTLEPEQLSQQLVSDLRLAGIPLTRSERARIVTFRDQVHLAMRAWDDVHVPDLATEVGHKTTTIA